MRIIGAGMSDRRDIDSDVAFFIGGNDDDRAGTDLSAFFRSSDVLITPKIGIRNDKARRGHRQGHLRRYLSRL